MSIKEEKYKTIILSRYVRKRKSTNGRLTVKIDSYCVYVHLRAVIWGFPVNWSSHLWFWKNQSIGKQESHKWMAINKTEPSLYKGWNHLHCCIYIGIQIASYTRVQSAFQTTNTWTINKYVASYELSYHIPNLFVGKSFVDS